MYKNGLFDHHRFQSRLYYLAQTFIMTTIKIVKFLLLIVVSVVLAVPSQGNPSNSWFSAVNSNDILSTKDAQVIIIFFLKILTQ